jgi:hypothetical protein
MRNLLGNVKDLWPGLIATEWVFVGAIFILGSLFGFVAVKQAKPAELAQFAKAVLDRHSSNYTPQE